MNKTTIKVKQNTKPQKIAVKHKSLTRYDGVKITTGTLEHQIRNTIYGGTQ